MCRIYKTVDWTIYSKKARFQVTFLLLFFSKVEMYFDHSDISGKKEYHVIAVSLCMYLQLFSPQKRKIRKIKFLNLLTVNFLKYNQLVACMLLYQSVRLQAVTSVSGFAIPEL